MDRTDIFTEVICAAQSALRVPLIPAPCRGKSPCAVYRYRPGAVDGAGQTAHLEVCVFAPSVTQAEAELTSLRRALVTDGDTGLLGTEAHRILVCGTDNGSAGGYVRDCGLYFLRQGFILRARA